MPQNYQTIPPHVPVLLHEVLATLAPRLGETYLDLTAGYGNHAKAILEQTQNPRGTVLVDRDEQAHQALLQQFEETAIRIF